ncbi:formylglycine-generating enzyme family protein [Streptomyces griseiscabiei]|uniref:Formylglycine-generating enzyme family protein n=2 Tax=Streptomyces griseiscabiei TaxID=2993540 RepID=A0ABU4L3L6_9ACTN|nr:formylglycine-generating enzyme family protein [Streptomyces griseiscabiei]MBZ3905241.1 formylglycine-generating enzyme family protein [Streptomyces griseiscabiei]MDX2910327.1 formylglycine-generating enzyme family protein [Streptomyces griseiscabiei]
MAHDKPCCAPGREPVAGALGGPVDVPSGAAPARGGERLLPLPGGVFLMGTEDEAGYPADGEGPVREVRVRPFRIAATTVTNERFAEFVDATGHVTESELFGFSFVFEGFLPADVRAVSPRVPGTPWWRGVRDATWRRPAGPGSSVDALLDHPVVHVSWNDAQAYCAWSGTRLPTEAEWEYAARGGLAGKRYPWGDELAPGGRHLCNIWRGTFPTDNTAADGHRSTAPADAFEPNGFGLYNTVGNVWEWCADRFSPDFHVTGPRTNPTGPPDGPARVMRGGSHLCHASYCNRYRVAARSSNTPDSAAGNIGFRVVAGG